MSNIVSHLPLPAILLLLFLVMNVGVIVVVKRRFAAKEAERPKPESDKAPEEKTVEPVEPTEPIKAAKPSSVSLFYSKKSENHGREAVDEAYINSRRAERGAQSGTKNHGSKPVVFYILGLLSWVVLLWPIVLFLQSKSQISSRSLLPEDKAKSYIQPLSQEQCDRISFIDVEDREIPVEGLSERFLPGDVLVIAVESREGEVAEKARVRINSSLWTEDNEIDEKSTEGFFILECPIDALSDGRPTVCGMPIGKRGKFAVEAEIFDSNDGVWK